MAIQIPQSYLAVIKLIARMSESDTAQLVKQLERAEPNLSIKKLTAEVQKMRGEEFEGGLPLFDFLATMHRVQIAVGNNDREFAHTIASALDDFDELDADDKARLNKNIPTLLGSDRSSLRVSSKGLHLFSENQSNFRSAKITTDIRPVFASEEDVSTPSAAIINHNLKVIYSNEDSTKELFITMDCIDLQSLKLAVERAIEKEKVLINHLRSHGTAVLDANDLSGAEK